MTGTLERLRRREIDCAVHVRTGAGEDQERIVYVPANPYRLLYRTREPRAVLGDRHGSLLEFAERKLGNRAELYCLVGGRLAPDEVVHDSNRSAPADEEATQDSERFATVLVWGFAHDRAKSSHRIVQSVEARAVLIDAAITRQSSRFSATIGAVASAESKEVWAMTSSQMVVSLSSLETIFSLWMKSARLSAARASP